MLYLVMLRRVGFSSGLPLVLGADVLNLQEECVTNFSVMSLSFVWHHQST